MTAALQVVGPEYLVGYDGVARCFGHPDIGAAHTQAQHRIQRWAGSAIYTTPVGGGPNPRDALTYGDYFPDASNTGPMPGTQFITIGTPSTSVDLKATSNNQVLDGYYVWGRLDTGGFTGVKFKNVIVRGSLNRTFNDAYVVRNGSGDADLGGVIVEDFQFMGRPVVAPAGTLLGQGRTNFSNEWCNPVRGGNFTFNRGEITRASDGITPVTTIGNVHVNGCWIHQGAYSDWDSSLGSASGTASGFYPYSTGTANYTHSDGVQLYRGKNQFYVGCRIGGDRIKGPAHNTAGAFDILNTSDDLYNSCLMIKQEGSSSLVDKLENIHFDRCWLAGGVATINFPTSDKGNLFESLYITGCRMKVSTWGSQLYALVPLDGSGQPKVAVGNWSNNVMYDDAHLFGNGTPMIYSPGQ